VDRFDGWRKCYLWILANWFVLGGSIFVRAFTYESTLARFQMVIMGVVTGECFWPFYQIQTS